MEECVLPKLPRLDYAKIPENNFKTNADLLEYIKDLRSELKKSKANVSLLETYYSDYNKDDK